MSSPPGTGVGWLDWGWIGAGSIGAGPGLDRGWIWCSLIQPDPAPIYFWWSTFWVLGSTFWRYDWASCCAQSRIIIVQNPRGNFFDPGWLRMGFPCLGWWQSPIQWHCDTIGFETLLAWIPGPDKWFPSHLQPMYLIQNSPCISGVQYASYYMIGIQP